jgi:hypothetical protein
MVCEKMSLKIPHGGLAEIGKKRCEDLCFVKQFIKKYPLWAS